MASSLEGAFLEDIIAHPYDDVPRLIYADWLEDQGDSERAEFIRVQHALAALPLGDARFTPLLCRADLLLSKHETGWRADLPEIEGVTWEDFSRGFVEAVFVESVEVFLEKAPEIFASTPIRRLQIGQVNASSVRRLARSPYLARLSELNLANNPEIGRGGVHTLTRSPHLTNLRVLLLHYNELGDEAAGDLARSRTLTGLEELYFSGNEITDRGAVALANSKGFPRLADLDLRDNRIGAEGAVALAQAADRQAMETLYLVNNEITAAGGVALAFSTSLPNLARLYLNYNPLENEGATALAGSPHRSALKDLDLRNCGIRDTGARALAASPYLEGIELLWMGGNRIRVETMTLLRRRFEERVRF